MLKLGKGKEAMVNTKKLKALTLLETVIAAGVLLGVLSAWLGVFVSTVEIIDTSRQRSTATSHLRDMFERIRATPFDSIVTDFPDGVTDGPGANPYTSIVGNYTLSNEEITVTYANASTDPLEIKVSLNWLGKKQRPYNASLSTFRTR